MCPTISSWFIVDRCCFSRRLHYSLLLLLSGDDRRAGAARCLGELVRKMGERVLHRMLPILRDGMSSSDSATRQGVCAGLKEVSSVTIFIIIIITIIKNIIIIIT